MNLRWVLENWGYKHLLRDDNGIQFAFAKKLDLLAQSGKCSYIRKLLILLKLCFEINVMRNTPWDVWEKKKSRLRYPEWNNRSAGEIAGYYKKIGKEKRILVQWRDILVFPVFRNEEREKHFFTTLNVCKKGKEAKTLCDFYIYNEQLLELIKKKPQAESFILFAENEWEKWALAWRERFYDLGTPIIYDDQRGYTACLDDTAFTLPEDTFVLRSGDSFRNVKADVIFPDIRDRSQYYRCYLDTSPVIKYYNALITCKLHLPSADMNFFYGAGYKYAGILCCGVCCWLKQLIQVQGIDKLLFCARDGDIFQKIYDRFFSSATDYLFVSRRAISEVSFEDYPEEYMDNYWLHRAKNRSIKFSIGKELEDFGLSFMSKYYESYDINPENYLTPKEYEKIKRMVLDHRQEVKAHLMQHKEAGLTYLAEMLSGQEKIGIVDLGWHGTTFRYLQKMSQKYGWDNELVGILVAAAGDETISNCIHLGSVFTYLFTDDKMRIDRNIGIPLSTKQVFCLEKMFSSVRPSLKHYGFTGNREVKFEFKETNRYPRQIAEMHRGIIDFAEDFMPFIMNMNLQIHAEDAWLPMADFLNSPRLVDMFYKLILQEHNTNEE